METINTHKILARKPAALRRPTNITDNNDFEIFDYQYCVDMDSVLFL